ncbi:folate-dependent protein [alpha proteobacterium U9-1i]|nr:folate-dependent protein [alpha proteobacterium U9-1i]
MVAMQPLRLDRTLIRVGGPDARPFLDNLLTQDLGRLDREPVVYAALLSPQGKVSADMFVWRLGDALLLDADEKNGEALLKRLTMYKLRAAVTLDDVSSAHAVLVSDAAFEGASPDPRLASLGWRAIAPRSDGADGFAWCGARLLAEGAPDLARDAERDEVFAGEALLEELNGVDFKKGCFVGQENVSRMKRRATTRTKFCPVTFDGPALPFSADIKNGSARIGSIRSGEAGRAIALLRLDRALEAEAAGERLEACGVEIRLAPPAWLILPSREASKD